MDIPARWPRAGNVSRGKVCEWNDERAYEAIAAVYEDWGFGKLGWTPDVVAKRNNG